MKIVINFAIYQVIWFLSILGESKGALLALPLLGVHLIFFAERKSDLKMMLVLLSAGLVIDGSLYHAGFFEFNESAIPIPFWLAVIWLALATLPHHSLSWLKERPFLSAIFGALGGPLAYWAGVRLGAASFNWPLVSSLMLLGLIWAVLWPVVMYFAKKDSPIPLKACRE